ncbi:hypothetical protein [Caldimonas sp. KR1-144]|uniref:hypothetical protein n=1 Tax=Caldimonas sp. KR1-144 TaxID=3400911 RepID=UPI003C069622
MPRYTKKDFEMVADVLKRARKAVLRTGDTHVSAQFDVFFVPAICDELAETNPKFDRKRFAAACGVFED